MAIEIHNPDGGWLAIANGLSYIAGGITVEITSPGGSFCDPFSCGATGLDQVVPPLPAAFRWEKNGAPVVGAAAQLAGGLLAGDEVVCIATIGAPENNWEVRSTPLTVLEGVADVVGYRMSPSQPSLGEAIRCEAAALPTHCGEAAQLRFEWLIDNLLDPNANGPVLTTVGLPPGTTIECRAFAVSAGGRRGPESGGNPLTLSTGRYLITSDVPNDSMGFSVAVPGDLNGDGLDDILVGAPTYAEVPQFAERGRVYALYGKADLADQAVATDTAFTLYGESGGRPAAKHVSVTRSNYSGFDSQPYGDTFGYALGGGRYDFDGDAIPDFAVGAVAAADGASLGHGKSYVFAGVLAPTVNDTRRAARADDLSATTLIGAFGYRGGSFNGHATRDGDMLGAMAHLVQDFDGDGYDDLLTGAPSFGDRDEGTAYLVPGGRIGQRIPLGNAAAVRQAGVMRLLAIGETRFFANWGRNGGSAGDLDGDGLGDLYFHPSSLLSAIATVVIYGREITRDIDVRPQGEPRIDFGVFSAGIGQNGFVVNSGRGAGGTPVAAGGDINGDGLDDVVYRALVPGARTELLAVFGNRTRTLPTG